MIKVPVNTVERPITVVDYIAALEQASTIIDVRSFGEQVPMAIRQDDRFTRAVQKRLAAIKGRKAA